MQKSVKMPAVTEEPGAAEGAEPKGKAAGERPSCNRCVERGLHCKVSE